MILSRSSPTIENPLELGSLAHFAFALAPRPGLWQVGGGSLQLCSVLAVASDAEGPRHLRPGLPSDHHVGVSLVLQASFLYEQFV